MNHTHKYVSKELYILTSFLRVIDSQVEVGPIAKNSKTVRCGDAIQSTYERTNNYSFCQSSCEFIFHLRTYYIHTRRCTKPKKIDMKDYSVLFLK